MLMLKTLILKIRKIKQTQIKNLSNALILNAVNRCYKERQVGLHIKLFIIIKNNVGMARKWRNVVPPTRVFHF